jgi:hypothetical protein
MSQSEQCARSEDQIPIAMDKCIADGIIKTGEFYNYTISKLFRMINDKFDVTVT